MDTEILLSFFIGLGILVGIFFLLREVVLWYWKVNKIIESQETIIRNQKKQIWLKIKQLEKSGTIFSDEENSYLKND